MAQTEYTFRTINGDHAQPRYGEGYASWPVVREHLRTALAAYGVAVDDVMVGTNSMPSRLAVSLIRGTHQHAGEVRRDTYANMIEDATTLAEQARRAFAKVRCRECDRLGPPRLGSCSECGMLGSEVEREPATAAFRWHTHAPPSRPEHLAEDRRCYMPEDWSGAPNPRVVLFARQDTHERAQANQIAQHLRRIGIEACVEGGPNEERNIKYGPSTAHLIDALLEITGLSGLERVDGYFCEGDRDVYINLPPAALANPEALPEGWEWHDELACLAHELGGGRGAWAGIRANRRTPFSHGRIPDAVWSAVEARARRLNLL
jgi:hypothetical protein